MKAGLGSKIDARRVRIVEVDIGDIVVLDQDPDGVMSP
jgi:hypothetical protein